MPDAPCQVQGDRGRDVGASSTGGPTASPPTCSTPASASRPRWPRTSTTAPSTSSRCSAPSRPASCRSTPTTATPTTSSSTCGTTPTPWPSCSTARFADAASSGIRDRLPKVRRWSWVDDGPAPCPDWAVALRGRRRRRRRPDGRRRGAAAATTSAALHRRHHRHAEGRDVAPGRPVQRARRRRQRRCSARRRRRRRRRARSREPIQAPGAASMLPACPLMHGTGQFSSFIALNGGGTRRHAADRAASTPSSCATRSSASGVNAIVIVGDAFAKPMLRALDADPGRWDLVEPRARSSSSGVMWSEETKQGLLAPHPERDARSTRSARPRRSAWAARSSAAGAAAQTAKFTLGDERARCSPTTAARSSPAPARSACVAVSGYMPGRLLQGRGEVGGDVPQSSTASATRCPATAPQVEADGTLTCSAAARCASTPAARRSTPRRSRRSLKTAPGRASTPSCVGVPDERFGEAITAVVEPAPGADARRGRRSSPT